jgi:hypothetical protein
MSMAGNIVVPEAVRWGACHEAAVVGFRIDAKKIIEGLQREQEWERFRHKDIFDWKNRPAIRRWGTIKGRWRRQLF